MVKNVGQCKRGFTLLEVLVALVILALILLGNLAALSLSYRKNVENVLRDEAVKVAQEMLERYRNGEPCPESVTRQIRNYEHRFIVSCSYNSTFNSTPHEVSVDYIVVTVNWTDLAGEDHSISMESYVE